MGVSSLEFLVRFYAPLLFFNNGLYSSLANIFLVKMSEDINKRIDQWEKEIKELVTKMSKTGKESSQELEKQVEALEKKGEELKKELEEKGKEVKNDLSTRLDKAGEKIKEAWEELTK